MNRLIRLLQINEELSSGPIKALTLARRHGISRKTIYKDLHILSLAMPIYNEKGIWKKINQIAIK